MIAWKYTTDFDMQKHLFFGEIKTGYMIEAYICSCGHSEFIVKSPQSRLDYTCAKCKNEDYHDANQAWKNLHLFLSHNLPDETLCQYDITSSDLEIIARYSVEIPTSIEFLSKKVIWSKKPIYSITISMDGKIKKEYETKPNKEIFRQLEENILQEIDRNGTLSTVDFRDKKLSLKIVSFFLKNRHLKDIDFYFWKDVSRFTKCVNIQDALDEIVGFRREKSVKKAVYQNYIQQMDNYKSFDSFFIELLIETIEDVNILVNFLKLDFALFSHVDAEFNNRELISFIRFLKSHYTEKQILAFFTNIDILKEQQLLRDTFDEYFKYKELIDENFVKVRCKCLEIHDEIMRLTRGEHYKEIFSQTLSYSDSRKKACMWIDTYSIKLPHNGKQLYDWAEILPNCLANYFYKKDTKEITVYGFFKEDILVFAASLDDHQIIEARGKHNAGLNAEEEKVLALWFTIYSQMIKQT